MTRNPESIPPDAPIRRALEMMRRGGFRRLPVLDGDRLIGILSDRDLRQAMLTPMIVHEKGRDDYILDHVQVGTCMTAEVATLSPADSLEKAAKLMRRLKVGGCPVLEGDRLVGLITESDLLGYLVECLEKGALI
jgi:acetoin utilization protein AcuB